MVSAKFNLGQQGSWCVYRLGPTTARLTHPPEPPSASMSVDATGHMTPTTLQSRGRAAASADGVSHGPVSRPRHGTRGGVFDALSTVGLPPGDAAPSVEGWVVLVSNLSLDVTEGDLKDAFVPLRGKPMVRMNPSAATCGCPGHAFVQFDDKDSALEAIARLHGQPLNGAQQGGLPLSVAFAFQVPSQVAAEEDSSPPMEAKRNRDGPEVERD